MRALNIRSQSGMVLVTSLVILMILTMLGLSSVQGTSIQELISRNQRDSNIAFNAAETTIINAEGILETLSATDWESIVESAYATSASPKVYNAELSGSFLETRDTLQTVITRIVCRRAYPMLPRNLFISLSFWGRSQRMKIG